jgi:hypothetical protein
MRRISAKCFALIVLLSLNACQQNIPDRIAPDPFGTPPDCTEISDEEEATRLITKVSHKQAYSGDEYFHYVAYNCGDQYDLVRHQLRPDIDVTIMDGGAWYYIDRRSGRVIHSFFEG